MSSILSILLIIIYFLVVPYVLGHFWNGLNGVSNDGKTVGFSTYFPFGFAIMLALFQIIAVPMIALHVPFHILNLTWNILVLLLCAISIIINKKRIIDDIKEKQHTVSQIKIDKSPIIWIFVIAMIVFQTYLLSFNMHTDTDDCRFIAEAMEAYEQDTMLMIHPINGNFIGNPVGEMKKELSAAYPFLTTVLAKVTLLHPAVLAHVILPLFLIPLCYLTIFGIGKYFIKEDLQSLGIFMLIFSFIVLFSFESIYAFGYTLLAIIWQGRSIVSTIMLPFLWLLLMKSYTENPGDKFNLAILITSVACSCLSGMGAMMSIIMTFVYAACILIVNKRIRSSILLIVSTVPSIVYFLYYCVTSGGK